MMLDTSSSVRALRRFVIAAGLASSASNAVSSRILTVWKSTTEGILWQRHEGQAPETAGTRRGNHPRNVRCCIGKPALSCNATSLIQGPK